MSARSSEIITYKTLGLTKDEFIQLSNTGEEFSLETLMKVFDMDEEQLTELYRQCGAGGSASRTLGTMYSVMMWLHATGRSNFGLTARGTIDYLVEREERLSIDLNKADSVDARRALKKTLGVQDEWLLRYVLVALLEGCGVDRWFALNEIFANCRGTMVREDYRKLDEHIDLTKMMLKRSPMPYCKNNLYAVLDKTKIKCNLEYSGMRNELLRAIGGGITVRESVRHRIDFPLVEVVGESVLSKRLRDCLQGGTKTATRL